MTDLSKKTEGLAVTLTLLCLFASVAVFVSAASASDDDVQQVAALSIRRHSLRLMRATHPADVLARNTSITAVVVMRPQLRPVPEWVSATFKRVLPLNKSHIQPSGDLPPGVPH